MCVLLIRGTQKKMLKMQDCIVVLLSFLGLLPITSHIYSTQFLDDNIPKERQLGLNIGLELLSECQEMWVFGLG